MKILLVAIILGLLMSSWVAYDELSFELDEQIERIDSEQVWLDKGINFAMMIFKAVMDVGYGIGQTFGAGNALFWAFALIFVDILFYPVAWLIAVIVILVHDHLRKRRTLEEA